MRNIQIWIFFFVTANVFVAVSSQELGQVTPSPPVSTSGSSSNSGTPLTASDDPWMQLMLAYQNMMRSMTFGNYGNRNMMTSFPFTSWGWDDDGYDIFDD